MWMPSSSPSEPTQEADTGPAKPPLMLTSSPTVFAKHCYLLLAQPGPNPYWGCNGGTSHRGPVVQPERSITVLGWETPAGVAAQGEPGLAPLPAAPHPSGN